MPYAECPYPECPDAECNDTEENQALAMTCHRVITLANRTKPGPSFQL